MSRPSRRHDKLLRQYLTVARERAEAEAGGALPAKVKRLAVRERALAASLRWTRLELGLPESFDPSYEAARLGIDATSPTRRTVKPRSRARDESPFGPERPRVKPVPAPPPEPEPEDNQPGFDVPAELVGHAARFCARRAAEELLEHRTARAPAQDEDAAEAWPMRPLDRTASGELYAGSAGRLMGALVSQAHDSEESAERAGIAVRNYVDEFVTAVVAALQRERDASDDPGDAAVDLVSDELVTARRDLARAACVRIAVEVRVARRDLALTAEDVAALSRHDGDPISSSPDPSTQTTGVVTPAQPSGAGPVV